MSLIFNEDDQDKFLESKPDNLIVHTVNVIKNVNDIPKNNGELFMIEIDILQEELLEFEKIPHFRDDNQ